MSFEFITAERKGRVGVITLNRPKQLNALSPGLMAELGKALLAYDADAGIGAILLTGSEKAFAAGADIAAMKDFSYMQAYLNDYITTWEHFRGLRKPVIAAVAGYALGGGCELAMQADFIIAADSAKFGQPEINLGVAPGIGGTQRLTRSVGKSKAMDLILTGRMMGAEEAERCGLAARVVPADQLMEETMTAAKKIAASSQLAAMMNKEMVNAAFETPLHQGVRLERRLFHSLFAFEDQKEGMSAFVEKRKPEFKGR